MALTSKEQALFTRFEDTEDEISGVLGTRDAQSTFFHVAVCPHSALLVNVGLI
jgi:hypothetical protein